MARSIFALSLAMSIAVSLTACVGSVQTEPALSTATPERPPNPEIDLGPWQRPSRPVMESSEPLHLNFKIWGLNVGKVKLLRRHRMKYNEALLEGACSRTAYFIYDVNRWGAPIRTNLVQSSGSTSFDRAADQTPRSWQYERISDHEPEEYRKDLQATLSMRNPECNESSG